MERFAILEVNRGSRFKSAAGQKLWDQMLEEHDSRSGLGPWCCKLIFNEQCGVDELEATRDYDFQAIGQTLDHVGELVAVVHMVHPKFIA